MRASSSVANLPIHRSRGLQPPGRAPQAGRLDRQQNLAFRARQKNRIHVSLAEQDSFGLPPDGILYFSRRSNICMKITSTSLRRMIQPLMRMFQPLLRNPVFRRLWIASVLSGMFVSAQDIAATWFMNDIGASPFELSLMATAASAPFLFFTLPAGAVADIANRRVVIVIALLWQAACSALLALGAWTRVIDPYLVLAWVRSFRTSSAKTIWLPRSRWEECS
jgi:hypothetical protein